MSSDLPSEPGRLPPEAELDWVRAELAALPRPTLPPEVAARIVAALQAEAAAAPPAPPSSRRPVLGWIGAAAALIVVAGIAVGVLRPSAQPTATVDVGAPAGSSVAVTSPEMQAVSLQVSSDLAAPPATLAPTASSVVVPVAPTGSGPTRQLQLSTALFVPGTFAATAEGLADCLKGLGITDAPLLTERVHLGSTEAVAVALRTGAGQFMVYVVGIHCSSADPGLLGKVEVTPGQPPAGATGQSAGAGGAGASEGAVGPASPGSTGTG